MLHSLQDMLATLRGFVLDCMLYLVSQMEVSMKPEEFAKRFFEVAEEMGCEFTPHGNILTVGGKNISPGKATAIYRRHGAASATCPSREFASDAAGLKQFRMIASKALA